MPSTLLNLSVCSFHRCQISTQFGIVVLELQIMRERQDGTHILFDTQVVIVTKYNTYNQVSKISAQLNDGKLVK